LARISFSWASSSRDCLVNCAWFKGIAAAIVQVSMGCWSRCWPVTRVANRDRRDRSGPTGPPFGPLRSGPTPRGLRTEFTYLLSFIRPRNPQLAATPPRRRLYIITFFVFFQQGVSSSPAACVLYCYFPSLITSISHHLCLVLFFFNQQCGKVQCTMRNAQCWWLVSSQDIELKARSSTSTLDPRPRYFVLFWIEK